MNIDYPIFKQVVGKDANFKNKKDVYTMVAIHYLLNANMIFDNNRIYDFEMTSEGLRSSACYQSIKKKEDFDPTPIKFSKKAKIVFKSIHDAVTKTAVEYEYGPQTILIASAGLCFIKNNLTNSLATEKQIKKYFDKKFKYLAGLYEICEKTLLRIETNKKTLMQKSKTAKQKFKPEVKIKN